MRIRWIPKSVCDLCGDHLDASLGASQVFWPTFAKKKFWFLESLLSTDQLDFCYCSSLYGHLGDFRSVSLSHHGRPAIHCKHLQTL